MKEKFLNYSINTIKNNNNISKERLEIITYGLESLYLTLTKIFVILILSIILGLLKEVLLIILFYNVIRLFAFGLHAKTSTECLLTSIFMFIGGAYISIHLQFGLLVKLSLSIISIILISLYAPADTVKRPLINKHKRIKFKILSILTSLIMTTILLIYNNSYISNFMLIGLLEETIMILPITYKLYKLPYNNYKTYKKVFDSKKGGS